MKRPSLPKFQLSECYIGEMGPKNKKRKLRNEECVSGSVGCSNQFVMFLTHHESDAKKRLEIGYG